MLNPCLGPRLRLLEACTRRGSRALCCDTLRVVTKHYGVRIVRYTFAICSALRWKRSLQRFALDMYIRNTHCAAGTIIITIATTSIAIVVITIIIPLPLQLLSIHESSWFFGARRIDTDRTTNCVFFYRVGSILLKTMKNKRLSLVGSILLEKCSKSKSITV